MPVAGLRRKGRCHWLEKLRVVVGSVVPVLVQVVPVLVSVMLSPPAG